MYSFDGDLYTVNTVIFNLVVVISPSEDGIIRMLEFLLLGILVYPLFKTMGKLIARNF